MRFGAEDECEICLEIAPPPIRSGCACRGLTHVSCRARVASRDGIPVENTDWYKCPTCMQPFTGEMRRGLARELTKLVRNMRSDDEDKTGAVRFATMNELLLLIDEGLPEQAERGARRIAAELRDDEETPDNPITAAALVALTLGKQGKHKEAEEIWRTTLEASIRVTGRESQSTANAMGGLATALSAQGMYTNAAPLFDEAVSISSSTKGPNDAITLSLRASAARSLAAQGRHDEAERAMRAVLALRTRVLGPAHPETLSSKSDLSETLARLGNLAEAETLQRETLAADTGDRTIATANLARTLELQGKHDAAERLLRSALKHSRGSDHPHTLVLEHALASSLLAQRKFNEAAKLGGSVYDKRRSVLGPEHPATIQSAVKLGGALLELGRNREAEQVWRHVYAHHKDSRGESDHETLRALRELVVAIWNQGRLDEAVRMQRDLVRESKRSHGFPDVKENEAYLLAMEDAARKARPAPRPAPTSETGFHACPCGKPGTNVCSGCNAAWYCSRECQKANWRQHKKECRA